MRALENLNNAISRLERVSGPTSDAAELAGDWSDWFHSNVWRSLGPVGIPAVYGTAYDFWERYQALWEDLTPAEQRQVPRPSKVEPTLAALTGSAAEQAVEANQAAADVAKEVGEDVVEATTEVIDEVERRAVKATWLVLVPIGIAIFLARRR